MLFFAIINQLFGPTGGEFLPTFRQAFETKNYRRHAKRNLVGGFNPFEKY